MMTVTHTRPKPRNKADRQKRIESSDSCKQATRGFAYWLEVAPKTTTFAQVVEAYQEYDDPHEVWDSGPNQRLTDFGGESR
jgi:hypothetical protein